MGAIAARIRPAAARAFQEGHEAGPWGDLLPPRRGRGHSGREHPAQWAPAQGKALAALPVWCCWAGCRCGCVGTGSCGAASPRFLEGWEAEQSHPPSPPATRGQPSAWPLWWAQPCQLLPLVPQAGECSDTFSTFDVPIFTEEFLDQNKGRGWGRSLESPCEGSRSWLEPGRW